MPTSPDTSDTLIAKLGDPLDRESWEEFVSVYRPLIFRIAHQHRLQHADAENLMQDVLAKVNRQTSQWESEERTGSFRGWLASVARNAAVDAIRRIRPMLLGWYQCSCVTGRTARSGSAAGESVPTRTGTRSVSLGGQKNSS